MLTVLFNQQLNSLIINNIQSWGTSHICKPSHQAHIEGNMIEQYLLHSIIGTCSTLLCIMFLLHFWKPFITTFHTFTFV